MVYQKQYIMPQAQLKVYEIVLNREHMRYVARVSPEIWVFMSDITLEL
jgi:hypothetical protein